MSALAFNLLRIAYLVLLWLFVLFAIGVLRRDLLTRVKDNVTHRGRRRDRDEPVALAAAVATPRVAGVPNFAPLPNQANGSPVYSVAGVPLPPGAPPPAGSEPIAKPKRRSKAAAVPTQAPSELVVTAGSLAGTRIPLSDSSVLIGRAPTSTLVINDDFASSRHARIFQQAGEWLVEDLGSTNGTFVGGQQISGPLPLSVGSTVQIGQSTIELR